MKNIKELLVELRACKEAREWAANKSIEQVVAECHRGDWLLWLAKRVGMDLQTYTLTKGLCANTVRHLMKDERSINAVDVAIAFGKGEATRDELDAAAADAAAYAAYAAYAAADVFWFAAYAAYAAADAYAAAYAANAAADAAAKEQNQQQTADICREVFGNKLIELVNQKLNK
jgi:hypothetical protein